MIFNQIHITFQLNKHKLCFLKNHYLYVSFPTMKSNVFGLLILLIVFVPAIPARAQYYLLGTDAASIKWKHIKTGHFDIVFPDFYSGQAQRLAAGLEYSYQHGLRGMTTKMPRIPVLIHAQSVVPNAYALWTPHRSEWFTTPPQFCYAHDWLDQLMVHEYRHMAQMAKLNRGATKILHFAVGEQATAFTMGLFLPMWFMEGDAVMNETRMSHSGRGRSPEFEMKVKAQMLSRGLFKYDKAVLGSFKEYVPDQYYFGYYFAMQSYRFYGDSLWNKAIDRAAGRFWQIAPLTFSFKQQTGFNKKQLYLKFFGDLKSKWNIQAEHSPSVNYEQESPLLKKGYTHYKFPIYINDSTLLCERSGYDDYARFVCLNIHTGAIKRVVTPGFYISEEYETINQIPVTGNNSPGAFTTDNLSFKADKLVWAEKRNDPRWVHRNYSVVMMHNTKTGETTQITHKSRLFAPALFPDGKRIAAVEISEKQENAIVIMDTKGQIIQRYFLPQNALPLTPEVSSDSKKLVYINLTDKGKALATLDLETGKETILLGPQYTEISRPRFAGEDIFFNASFSGIDNIYVYKTGKGGVFQFTYDLMGAYDLSFSPDNLDYVFSAYTNHGFVIKRGKTSEAILTSIDSLNFSGLELEKDYIEPSDCVLISRNLADTNFTIKPYRKSMHLFNIHSWLPAGFNAETYSVTPGITLMSQNLMSTSVLQTGYEYNINEQQGRFFASYSYSGLYPVISVENSTGYRTHFNAFADESGAFTYRENKTGFKISLPLLSSIRQFSQHYEVSFGISRHHAELQETVSEFPSGTLSSFNIELFFCNAEKTVMRDLAPHIGQEFHAGYRSSLSKGLDFGRLFFADATLFFPGIAKHHSIAISSNIQKKENGNYSFANESRLPRGYNILWFDDSRCFSFTYRLPLAYPDLNIGSLFYFKRLKAGLFADYGKIAIHHSSMLNTETNLKSYGIELSTDVHVLRFFIPLDIGIRTSYLPEEKLIRNEFLLSINFSGF